MVDNDADGSHDDRHKNYNIRQPNLGSAGAEERARGLRRHSGHAFQDATPGHTAYRGTLSNFAAEPMNVDSAEGDDADKDESLSDGISAHVGTPQRSTCPSVISCRCPQNETYSFSLAIRFAYWTSSGSKLSHSRNYRRILEMPTALRRQSSLTRRGCPTLGFFLILLIQRPLRARKVPVYGLDPRGTIECFDP